MIGLMPPVAVSVVLLAGCGGAAAAPHHEASAHAATVGTAVASPVNADPNRAADTALCRTYNSDITAGDTYDLQATLQQDAVSVSPKLMAAMQAVVNAGPSLRKDLKAQIKVTADCAMVYSGVSPGM